MARYRKSSTALTTGKLTQFVPRDGIYVYFRRAGDETVMVVFNGHAGEKTISLDAAYAEMLDGAQSGNDLTRNTKVTDLSQLKLKGKETRVIVLK